MTLVSDIDIDRIVAAGDSALLVEFRSAINEAINARATALAAVLRNRWSSILRDVVIGYCTITIYFDPLRVDARWLESEIHGVALQTSDTSGAQGVVVEVPVCYEGELAPDRLRDHPLGWARPAPSRRDAAHLRLLPRRLPSPDRAFRQGGAGRGRPR